MLTTLAITEELWQELAGTLKDPLETAGFLVAGYAVDDDEITLFVRDIHWVPEDGYRIRKSNRLQIGSEAFVPALRRTAEDDSVVVFFHSHPHGDPAPSTHDDVVDEELSGPAQIRTCAEIYASLILAGEAGEEGFSGRVFRGEKCFRLDRVRVVGAHTRLLATAGEVADRGRFDRQIRAFGIGGQEMLGHLHVGIVGAGGTGSTAFELLTRLGVGRITVIDDDDVSESNLTRIHESGLTDIERPKVEVAAAAAERIARGTSVEAVNDKITRPAALKHLRHCDLVFGCTDDNAGRAVLSRLAYWYLVPVIDTAFLVDTAGETVRGLFGRITTLYPGVACLHCRGRIDQRQLAAEALPVNERERLAAEGYVPGLGEPDPSVGAYTTLVASFAVGEMLDRFFSLSGEPEPPTELLLRLHDRQISSINRQPQPDHYCADRGNWGRGDEEPLLRQLWPAETD